MTNEERILSLGLQELRQREADKKRLSAERIGTITQNLARTILNGSDYDLSDKDEFYRHYNLIRSIGDAYMGRESSRFTVDENNAKVIQFLLYYFNNCPLAARVFPEEDYQLHKNLLICGNPGTGKTLLMQIFADYLKYTGNPNRFYNLSVTQMMNYYKMNGHIDRYTYNETEGRGSLEGKPFNVCLNDIGLETENQKSYGTSLDTVIDEFLYARYEIYQSSYVRYHLTSNLGVKDFKMRFGERLVDRFKSFNVISLLGPSRRK